MSSGSIPTPTTRALTAEDLPAVAELHRSAYAKSMLSVMGRGVVLRYLRWQFDRSRNAPFFVGAFDEDRLVGYLSGGIYNENIQVGFLLHDRWRILLAALTHPSVLVNREFWSKVRSTVRGFRRYRHLSKPESAPPVTNEPRESVGFHVMSVAVATTGRRRGIGGMLLEAAEREARARGIASMDASVAPDNAPSLALFSRAGYEVGAEVPGGLILVRRLETGA